MASASLNKVERAHQMYREGRHTEALGFYTEALAMAKTRPQKIALHSNRAACYLKLHDFKKAAEECSSVLELDHKHTGALMLRAQTLVTLQDYHSALFDVNRLLELIPTSEVYQNLQARLKTQLLFSAQGKSLAPIPECEVELEEEEEDREGAEDEEEGQKYEKHEQQVIGKVIVNEKLERHETGKALAKGNLEEAAERVQKAQVRTTTKNDESTGLQARVIDETSGQQPKGWKAIPKPKGHSNLDYSRWDKVQDDSSEEEDDEDDDCQPQYRFRVRTVGVRPVK